MTNPVREYKAALKVVKEVDPSTEVYALATEIIQDLKHQVVVYEVPCMLCRQKYEFRTTVDSASQLMDAPRGVCGRHGQDDVSVTVIEA